MEIYDPPLVSIPINPIFKIKRENNMQQATTNPYATPNAPVGDVFANEVKGDINIFTAKGRIGRVRYFYYSMLIGFVGMAAILLAMMLLNISPVIGGILIAAIYIAMIVLGFFLAIQRCHDLNISGWWSLLLFVPLAPLYFYFAPGTKGANQYGAEPRPNSKGVIIGAFILPIVLFILMSVLGAVVNPALSDYANRANTASMNIEQQ